MEEEVIDVHTLAPLVSDIQGLQSSIRRRLRHIWPDPSPFILSLVGAGLADLVRNPTIQHFPIEIHGAPPGDEHHVMDLPGLKKLLPAELRRLCAMVARYGVPELTFALLTEPDTLRPAETWLEEEHRRSSS